MSMRKEQEYILQQRALRELQQGSIDRREFLTRSLARQEMNARVQSSLPKDPRAHFHNETVRRASFIVR